MATSTPLFHPRESQQTAQFYPFTVTIRDVNSVTVGALVNLPCAYEPSSGGEVDSYEMEAPTQDRILLAGYFAGIRPKHLAVLNQNGVLRRFEIDDVLQTAHGTKTMLVVTPNQ